MPITSSEVFTSSYSWIEPRAAFDPLGFSGRSSPHRSEPHGRPNNTSHLGTSAKTRGQRRLQLFACRPNPVGDGSKPIEVEFTDLGCSKSQELVSLNWRDIAPSGSECLNRERASTLHVRNVPLGPPATASTILMQSF